MNCLELSQRRVRAGRLIGFLTPVLVLVVSLCASPAQAEDLPSADEVMDQAINAMGGKEAFEAVKSRVTRGTFGVPAAGFSGELVSYSALPNLSYMNIEIEGMGTMESGTDGDIVWEKNAMTGARIKEGPERATALREADLNSMLNWKALYASAVVDTVEMVEERPCYRVVMTPREGEGAPEKHYYNQETHLLTKISMVAETEMGDLPVEVLVSDYREVDGLLIAHKMVQAAMGMQQVMTLESVEHNVEIPADRFAVPEDIKALATKAPATD